MVVSTCTSCNSFNDNQTLDDPWSTANAGLITIALSMHTFKIIKLSSMNIQSFQEKSFLKWFSSRRSWRRLLVGQRIIFGRAEELG